MQKVPDLETRYFVAVFQVVADYVLKIKKLKMAKQNTRRCFI